MFWGRMRRRELRCFRKWRQLRLIETGQVDGKNVEPYVVTVLASWLANAKCLREGGPGIVRAGSATKHGNKIGYEPVYCSFLSV